MTRRVLAFALTVVLAVIAGVPGQFSAAHAAGPYLAVNGTVLGGASVTSPFTATVMDPGTVTAAGVTFLLDDSYVGKDTTAPYEWTVTTTAGAHKLKARWVDGSGSTIAPVANFTVTAAANPVLKAGNAALEGASVSSPFKATVVDPGTVTAAGVTFLLDDSYAGKDTTAPYEWMVIAGVGTHKLKARWSNGAGAQVEPTATFTVTSAANPHLSANGSPLNGVTLPAPFTAAVTDPGRAVEWHFTRSKKTGKIGPTKPLEDALKKAGIKVVLNP